MILIDFEWFYAIVQPVRVWRPETQVFAQKGKTVISHQIWTQILKSQNYAKFVLFGN